MVAYPGWLMETARRENEKEDIRLKPTLKPSLKFGTIIDFDHEYFGELSMRMVGYAIIESHHTKLDTVYSKCFITVKATGEHLSGGPFTIEEDALIKYIATGVQPEGGLLKYCTELSL